MLYISGVTRPSSSAVLYIGKAILCRIPSTNFTSAITRNAEKSLIFSFSTNTCNLSRLSLAYSYIVVIPLITSLISNPNTPFEPK